MKKKMILKPRSTEKHEVIGPDAICIFDRFKFSRFFPNDVLLFFFRQRASFLISIKIIWFFGLKLQHYLLNGALGGGGSKVNRTRFP